MKHIQVIAERPDVPQSWTVCNAPRPLCGTRTWTANGPTGQHYAAISPDDVMADCWTKQNAQDNAVIVDYVSHDAVMAWATAWAAENGYDISDLSYDDIVMSYEGEH